MKTAGGHATLNFGFLCIALLLAIPPAWALDCSPERITLNTQAEIDSFMDRHGPCDRVARDLAIVGFAIENLNGLSGLREIGGGLLIENTQAVVDLGGLELLGIVGGDVSIFHNRALVSLSGLDRLGVIEGDLAVFANPSQQSLDGLDSLGRVGGFLGISDLHSLETVTALEKLESVGSHLIVVFNHSLQRLDGLERLHHVGGYVRILLNPHLYACTALALLVDANDDGEPGPGPVALPDVAGLVEFEHNLPGCNGVSELLAASAFVIDPLLNGAWFSPGTAGHGVFVSVWEKIGLVFLGWTTYDTTRPPQGAATVIGDPGHRWLTGLGHYSANRADLTLEVTVGGTFNSAARPVSSTAIGSATLEFSSCDQAVLSFDLPSSSLRDVLTLRRIGAGATAECAVRRSNP